MNTETVGGLVDDASGKVLDAEGSQVGRRFGFEEAAVVLVLTEHFLDVRFRRPPCTALHVQHTQQTRSLCHSRQNIISILVNSFHLISKTNSKPSQMTYNSFFIRLILLIHYFLSLFYRLRSAVRAYVNVRLIRINVSALK